MFQTEMEFSINRNTPTLASITISFTNSQIADRPIMITRIAIENFKGIRDRVELDLRPITLLFGGNSAGKSTIFHAIQYSIEILVRQNLDPDQTLTGGRYVDLGGFRSFVNDHDLSKPVALEFTLNFSDLDLPSYAGQLASYSFLYEPGNVETVKIRMVVAWGEYLHEPLVSEYSVEINGVRIGSIEAQSGRKSTSLILNYAHPIFTRLEEERSLLSPVTEISALLDFACGQLLPTSQMSDPECWLPLATQGDALPDLERGLEFIVDDEAYSQSSDSDSDEFSEQDVRAALQAINELICGPGKRLKELLSTFRYLGPLRETPSRTHRAPRIAESGRWAAGLGAWDLLQTGPDNLIRNVSRWLGDTDKLNSGYTIRRKTFARMEILTEAPPDGRDIVRSESNLYIENDEHEDEILIQVVGKLLDLRPNDVGVGISQVVPVVVTALDGSGRLLAIEQPELHLHPRLQAELADLFIEAALGERHQQILLETHSELIPLRFMRRIRETHASRKTTAGPDICSSDVAIYFIESFEGATVVTHLELSEEGRLLDPWPDGFFEEGFRERFSD